MIAGRNQPRQKGGSSDKVKADKYKDPESGGKSSSLVLRLLMLLGMALSNYLLQSLLCLFIFTGAGMSLVGELHRWQLYGVVVAIWAGQLAFSPWWLSRYRLGPVEWLWRGLTYGNWPALRYI